MHCNPEPEVLDVAYVAVCSGLHVVPSVPEIPGLEYILEKRKGDTVHRQCFHSAQYKLRSQLVGRRILVLGTGETGMDLAYEAAKAGAKEVVLCSRAGFLSFPKALVTYVLAMFNRQRC